MPEAYDQRDYVEAARLRPPEGASEAEQKREPMAADVSKRLGK